MKMKYSFLLMLMLALAPAGAQEAMSEKEKDRKAILAMAGSYVVDFHFKEVASFQKGYELTPAYDSTALEWVVAEEVSENKIVLQHLLQTSRGIVKHWRQDWEYQNRILWEFRGDGHWEKMVYPPEEVKGTWTQRVFQVDDSPRYEAIGHWLHLENLSQWESRPTNRPLPRREYTKRSDYQILVAKNRHALTPTGWVHEQDNYKLARREDGDHVIAREFGLNRYDLTREDELEETRAWWAENRQTWSHIRKVWATVFANNHAIRLRSKLDGKPLYKHLFQLSEEASQKENYDSEDFQRQVAGIIDQFMEPEISSKPETTTGH